MSFPKYYIYNVSIEYSEVAVGTPVILCIFVLENIFICSNNNSHKNFQDENKPNYSIIKFQHRFFFYSI